MITELRQSVRSGEPILYAAENGAGAIVYLYASSYLDPSDHYPAVILTTPLDSELEHQLRAAGGRWVVFTGRPQTLAQLLPNCQIEVVAGVASYEGFMGGVFGRIVWKTP